MQVITWVALVLSVASFVMFVIFAALGFRLRVQQAPKAQGTDIQLQAGLSDIARTAEALAKLAESLGKFAESLAKAGPAIAALVASIVFLLMAIAASSLGR
jgi:hypothetical protein